MTPKKKVKVFAKGLGANNDFAVTSNRRFPAFIANEELFVSPVRIIRFASELDFCIEVPFKTFEGVRELVWAGSKGWSRAKFESKTKKRLDKSWGWFVRSSCSSMRSTILAR